MFRFSVLLLLEVFSFWLLLCEDISVVLFSFWWIFCSGSPSNLFCNSNYKINLKIYSNYEEVLVVWVYPENILLYRNEFSIAWIFSKLYLSVALDWKLTFEAYSRSLADLLWLILSSILDSLNVESHLSEDSNDMVVFESIWIRSYFSELSCLVQTLSFQRWVLYSLGFDSIN